MCVYIYYIYIYIFRSYFLPKRTPRLHGLLVKRVPCLRLRLPTRPHEVGRLRFFQRERGLDGSRFERNLAQLRLAKGFTSLTTIMTTNIEHEGSWNPWNPFLLFKEFNSSLLDVAGGRVQRMLWGVPKGVALRRHDAKHRPPHRHQSIRPDQPEPSASPRYRTFASQGAAQGSVKNL